MQLTRHSKWILLHIAFFLLLFFAYRFFLFYKFNAQGLPFSGTMWWYAFRYDIRVICVILLPVFLSSCIFGLSPFFSNRNKKFWNIYLSIFYIIALLFFALDYQYYAYRATRLDAEILGYTKDAAINLTMVWQSYPVLTILAIMIIVVFIIIKIVKCISNYAATLSPVLYNPNKNIITLIFSFLMAFAIYGKFSTFPLRWSDAFSLNNDYKANMCLNPMQSFFSTLKFVEEQPNEVAVRNSYALLQPIFQLPNADTGQLSFKRTIAAQPNTKPNVVIVLCESFSYYKSSMSGNPLNATPYFNQLAKQGIFFTNCFSPAYGTARGVWATITGIPDVTMTKTATRNPRAVKQHTIMNDFVGYEKFYFLGGNATWANIQGLINNNIDNVHLYQEGDYNAPSIDVWGISDNELFKAANTTFSQQKKPFVAVIQTAGNHRPYTIPKADATAMGLRTVPKDSLLKYGYNVDNDAIKTNEEFNAFRYFDYCIQQFIENAKQQPWYSNTIFLFVGDHGIHGQGGSLIPKVYTDKGLTGHHVPMLIVGKNIQPKQFDFPCSQLDVLPTMAGLAGVSYTNTTFGRDLLKIAKDTTAPKFAFIIDHNKKEYGLVYQNQYYYKKLNGEEEKLLPINGTSNDNLAYYQLLSKAILQTSRYLMFNNK